MDIAMSDAGPSTPSAIDGPRVDSEGNSPTSSIGASQRPRPKQVAIARSTASGYERPERARTSHACEPCRERKTKCDGERPACRRCLHTGTSCHYGYGKGWKKRKTAEDLTVTSRKLARYEELLNDIYPLVSPDVRNIIDDVRQQDYAIPGSHELTDGGTQSLGRSDNDAARMSSSMARLVSPAMAGKTESAPAFLGSARPLPASVSTDTSSSSIRSPIGPSKSPTEDGTGLVRLPSITRHGFLVDGVSRQPGNLAFPTIQDSPKPLDPRTPALHTTNSSTSDTSANPTG